MLPTSYKNTEYLLPSVWLVKKHISVILRKVDFACNNQRSRSEGFYFNIDLVSENTSGINISNRCHLTFDTSQLCCGVIHLCFCLLKPNNILRVNGKITLNDFEKKGATIIVSIVLSGNHQEGALATRYCGA